MYVNVGIDMFPNKKQKENPIKSIVEKRKYEKSVSECNKLHTFISIVVRENITVLSKKNTIISRFNMEKKINTS